MLHNIINKNLMLSNVITFNVPRNNGDDEMSFGKTLSMTSTTDGEMIHHAQDQLWSAISSEPNIRFVGNPIVLHWEDHNSPIQSAIEINENLMESLFDKLSNRSSPTSISHQKILQIIMTSYCCICLVQRRCLGPHNQPWDLAQVGECPNHVENTSRMLKDILFLGHHLMRLV
jgi:hypothetical protein